MANEKMRMDMMQAMLEQDPHDPFLHYALALEYKAISEHDQALARLEQLYQTHPDYLPTYYQLGQMLVEKNQLEQAIAIYREGRSLAKAQNEIKTLGEINEALLLLDADE